MTNPGPPTAWSPALGEILHFRSALETISGYCLTGSARDTVLALWPTSHLETLQERFTATGEIHQLLEQDSPPPLSTFPDIRPFLATLSKGGGALSAENLHMVHALLMTAAPVFTFLKSQEQAHYWQVRAPTLDPWPEGAKRIAKVVDDDLSIKSSASPQLRGIRQSIRRSEDRVRRRLEDIHGKALKAGWGQSEPIAWREGRLVIALKTSHKRKIKGLIHDHSSSGATAFVEPLEVFDLNNEITALREDEQAEIARLLAELTDELRPHSEALDLCVQVLQHLDVHLAQARWALAVSAVQPDLVMEGELRLTEAVNPILAQHRQVVPLTLVLGEPDKVLLVSGPNAGGKTVVLLTVGLAVMLAQSGIFVPAKEARLPLFQGLFADLGDRQSLTDDLSTFSAHLTNLRDIATLCAGDTLVLLDELGTGTEPEAGAALGQTFLERISSKGSWCLATTHLNRLKLWAQDADGIENAGMEFDPEKLEPTYQLLQGRPGASYALEIARRIGLEEELLARARELLPDAAVDLEELLISLRNDRADLDRLKTEAEAQSAELDRPEGNLTSKEADIRAVHRRARNDALNEAAQMVADMNRRLEAAITEVRTKGADLTRDDIVRLKGIVSDEKGRIRRGQAEIAEAQPSLLSPDDIRPGLVVAIPAQGSTGQVISLSRNRRKVTVQVGSGRLTVPVDQLAAAGQPEPEKAAATKAGSVHIETAVGGGGNRLDLRGMRGDAAVALVDRFIGQAIVANLRELEIIHGKGTGILQKLVREFLDDHPQVKAFQYANFDAGGTGVTLVELQ